MDPVVVLIVLAIAATAAAMFLGLLAMGGGGATDRWLSNPLMWVRVGLQALTVLLLVLATLLR
jgi:hypothetical protein